MSCSASSSNSSLDVMDIPFTSIVFHPPDWVLGPKTLDKVLAGNYDSITSNGHAKSLTCTKRLSNRQLLKPCGAPADPQCRPAEPRCSAHLTLALQLQEVTVC